MSSNQFYAMLDVEWNLHTQKYVGDCSCMHYIKNVVRSIAQYKNKNQFVVYPRGGDTHYI